MTFRPQTQAILWAQWRSLMNRSPLTRRSVPVTALVMLFWYGCWSVGAIAVASVIAGFRSGDGAGRILVPGLFLTTLYWQFIPVLLASSGVSLDLRRLIVYPIPHRELFSIEVALRVTAALEMLIMSAGIACGVLFNPVLPKWGAASMLLFVLFNLLMSSAVRDLLGRLMGRKHVRELVVLGVVLLSAVPQVLMRSEHAPRLAGYFKYFGDFWWPWSAAALFATGHRVAASSLVLTGWCAAAYLLARRQFETSLVIPAGELRGRERAASRRGLAEFVYHLPGRILSDPLAVMVEKELRTLSRSSRFRLVFIMAFTFGLIIWLPIGLRRGEPNWMTSHYLTVALGYEVMLLAEVMIWNVFGFDRRAAQVYFAFPVRTSTVLVAKNLSALFFTLLDAALIILICVLLGLRLTWESLGEALAVLLVLTLMLVAIGNLVSVRNPRAVDPDHSWGRSSAGRMQAVLLLVYPVAFGPIALAFLARSAFEVEWAFYAVLAFDLVVAAILYWVAFDSALDYARNRKEEILATLSREQGLLSG